MKLGGGEISELSRLCDAVVDGTLTEAQKETLNALLASSQEARQFYVRSMALSASLHTYASEILADAPDVAWQPEETGGASAWKWIAPLALAASLVLAFWVVDRKSLSPDAAPEGHEYVARLTASKDCQWEPGTNSAGLGDFLRRGQSVELSIP